MNYQDVEEKDREVYNRAINHPLQAFEWGEFRKKTGVGIVRRTDLSKGKAYQLTIHKILRTKNTIGYFPKGDMPDSALLSDLSIVGRENACSYVQLEPNVEAVNWKLETGNFNIKSSFHPLFTKYTLVLDLTKSEEELLKNMHQKTRYNVRLSEKRGVSVSIDNSDKAFEKYLDLTRETTKRQQFYAHNEEYHKLMWETLKAKGDFDPNVLQAHLLQAVYKKETLVSWILFTFKDTLYYPYGASSDKNREVMASSLTMWEAIKFGKKLGLEKFDMWGSLGPNPDPDHSWYGFHRFKEGYGPKLTEFIGSYDLVLNPLNYELLSVADKLRWAYLRAKKLR